MDSKFYIKNRLEYHNLLDDKSVSVSFSGIVFPESNDQDFNFSVNRNFYYLTGINQDNVILVLTKVDNKIGEVLFIEENDEMLSKWVGKKLTKEEVSNLSGIKDVRYINDFESYIYSLFNSTRKSFLDLHNMYIDLERRDDDNYYTLAHKFQNKFSKKYPEIKIHNSYEKMISLRMIKKEEEIKLIKESIDVTGKALENVMKNMKPGLYEYQIETYFDNYIKWHGHKKPSFHTICATGKNATILHYIKNESIAQDNDLVLFDLGCTSDLYISDISRTYPVNGKFTKRQKEIYKIVLDTNKACIKYLKPGISWGEYNKYANSLLIDGLKKIGLIDKDEDLIKYYWHSIGHSIGLDVHDPSLANVCFKEGMLTTVEPGLYLEDEGIGIRIEDNVLITKDGCINLSENIIKEIDDIEKFMKK